jgi:hypothetical protein
MKPFSFRQRVGRIDWKVISSCDTEEIVSRNKVADLQALLDILTFSEFDPIEVKTNTIDNVAKLVQLMQYTIEYLLYFQECQFTKIKDQNKKVGKLSEKNQILQQRLQTMKEDIRTYQRQLHILRKSIQAGAGGINTELLFRLVQQPPKVTLPIPSIPSQETYLPREKGTGGGDSSSQSTADMLKVLLDYEYDSRNMMNKMLEQQRNMFTKEIDHLNQTIETIKNSSSSSNNNTENGPLTATTLTLLIENLKIQFDKTTQQVISSLKDTFITQQQQQQLRTVYSQPLPSTTSNNHNNNNIDSLLVSADLEQSLKQREQQLQQRETILREKESQLLSKQKQLLQQDQMKWSKLTQQTTQQSIHYEDYLLQQEEMKIQKYRFGLSSFFHIFYQRLIYRNVAKRFRKWYTIIIELRIQDLVNEHAKQLLYSTQRKTQEETVLQQQLQQEKQQVTILQARLNAIQRENEYLREESKLAMMQKDELQRQNNELGHQMKSEKEKILIIQSKYNTLSNKIQHDRDELQEKLSTAEGIIAEQANTIAEQTELIYSLKQQPQPRRRLPDTM